MTGLLCVCYILLLLIALTGIFSVYIFSAWPVAFGLSFCFFILLCGMLGAMDTQVHMLEKRVAALEAEQSAKQDGEEDTAE